MTKFEIGKTYSTRSICDHNCIFSITVLSRTASFITVANRNEVNRLKVSTAHNGTEEQVFPNGRHSMAACIGATDTKELKRDWE